MIAWLIETLVAVTLLMAIVLLLRGPVARTFGAGWAYALWAVPVLRLVLPPLPQLAPDVYLPPAVLFIPTAAEMAAPLPAEAGPGQWVPFMLAMWAGGAVIFLILQWLGYRAFLGRIRDSSRPARPPLFGGIRTWISDSVDGPLALGVIERRIVLPGDFSRRYNPVERRLALEHELVHHKRGDIWWNLVATFVLAVFWFNPVAWLAFRAFRSDQELACDAAVARTASLDERCDYARALVKSASRPGLIAACALNPAGELKRRLRMMRNHRSSRLRSAGGIVALAAFAMAGFAIGSAGQPTAGQAAAGYALAPRAAAAAAPAAPVRLAALAERKPAERRHRPPPRQGGRSSGQGQAEVRADELRLGAGAGAASDDPGRDDPDAPPVAEIRSRAARRPPRFRLRRAGARGDAGRARNRPGGHSSAESMAKRICSPSARGSAPRTSSELRHAVAEAAAAGRKVKVRVNRGEPVGRRRRQRLRHQHPDARQGRMTR